MDNNKVVNQICIVRAVKKNGSGFILSLEPKKEPCPGCNGKCAKMLKPVTYIDFEHDQALPINSEVLIYTSKLNMVGLIAIILGVPVVEIICVALLGSLFAWSELLMVAMILLLLVLTFILQVKLLKIDNILKLQKM